MKREIERSVNYGCICVLIVLGVLGGCRIEQGDRLYQLSTIGALLVGVYDGKETFGELSRKGDFGLGTFNAIDGEMICLDGTFYQIKTDGIATPVAEDQKAPFALLKFFSADITAQVELPTDYAALQAFLDQQIPTDNIPYAIRVDGTFSSVKARSVPAQEKPYPPLADVVAQQTEFEFQDVTGTLVGFRMPSYMGGVNVSGYHFHFITEDRTAGGHVLECALSSATVSIDTCHDLDIEFPGDQVFYNADLDTEDAGNSEKIVEMEYLL